MNINAVFGQFPVIASDTLVLKEITPADAGDLFTIYDNERVFTWCGILPKHNQETVARMIGHFRRDYDKQHRVKWGIYPRSEGDRLVGIIEVMDVAAKTRSVTLGYYLAEAFWNKGYTTEAVRLMTAFLFEQADVNRIHAEIMPGNGASRAVLEKNGFVREGLLRQASLWPGKGIVDLEIFGLLRSDYNQRHH